MLRDLEGWLEYLLHRIQKLAEEKPAEIAVKAQEKHKQRRDLRVKVKKELEEERERAKNAKSAARASAVVVKRVGKPVMFRSPPIHKKTKQTAIEDSSAEREALELMKYFV